MIKGAIFDVDGTLLDSMYVWQTVGKRYLNSLGLEPRENLWDTFRTFTLRQSAQYYIDHYGVKLTVEEIMDGVNGLIEQLYFQEVQLRPGVPEFLEKLCSMQIPMVIATATHRRLVAAALKRCGVLRHFQDIITCQEAGSKNSPHIYETACAVLGTPKEHTWVFEDACHGAATAARAGFPVLGIYDSSEPHQQELKAVSKIYLGDFTETEKLMQIFSL